MNNTSVMALAALVGTVSLVFFLVVQALWSRRKAAGDRRLKSPLSAADSGILGRSLVPEPLGVAGRLDLAFERMIQRTGLKADASQALGFMCMIGVVLATLLFFWRGELWLTALGLALGSGGVLVAYLILQSRHQRKIEDQLPDTLYLLARSLRAGLSLEQAIALTGEQGLRPLADEFHRAAAQINLGLSVPAALQLLSPRVRALDFDAFVSTVSLHSQTGGNLALLLDRLAAGARDRSQFRNHLRAATALGRSTAICLGLAPPIFLLYYAIFQPEFAQGFFQSSAGWALLAVVAALEIIGIAWMYRLLSIEA